jgi:hypothetical protein
MAITNGFEMIGQLAGGAPPSEGRPGKRFDTVTGRVGPDGRWQPTELGEYLAYGLIGLLVRTAPDGQQTAAVVAAEESGALDRIWADLRRSIIREVKAVSA